MEGFLGVTAILLEQIKTVFGLWGGELEDRPLRYFARDGRRGSHRGWFRFWYPYVPDYAEVDFRRWGGSTSGDFFTAIWDSGSYGDYAPPRKVLLVGGKVARLVKTYRSGCESACLCQEGKEPPVSDCKICEGSGNVYLGEGWLEAVYRTRG